MNQFSTPSLITRTTNDVVQMQNFMAMGVQLLFKAPIMAIWAICKISATDVRWTLATIICVFIIVICVGILIALCLPRFKKIQRLTDELMIEQGKIFQALELLELLMRKHIKPKNLKMSTIQLPKPIYLPVKLWDY